MAIVHNEAMHQKTRLLIIGVGNTLRGDDGIGPSIIAHLRQGDVHPSVDYLDGGTDALALLEVLKDYSHAIIIDAVRMGEIPGVVKVFTPREVKTQVKFDALSTHGFGLAEMLALMNELNIQTKIQIIGIEPKTVSFGEGLSDVVLSKIPIIEKMVTELMHNFKE